MSTGPAFPEGAVRRAAAAAEHEAREGERLTAHTTDVTSSVGAEATLPAFPEARAAAATSEGAHAAAPTRVVVPPAIVATAWRIAALQRELLELSYVLATLLIKAKSKRDLA